MALPLILAGLGKAAANPAVQAGAARLLRDVYGRVSAGSRNGETVGPAASDLPTREEMMAAFALLQSEMDQQQRRTRGFLLGIGVVQLLMLAALFLR